MRLARRTRRLSLLTVTLSATALSTAALTYPASAAIARHPVPATASAIAGYIWTDNGTVEDGGYYSFNSVARGASAVTVSTSTTGVYVVDFKGMSSIADEAAVQITTYSSSDNCAVISWGPSGSDLQAEVGCFLVTTGAPDNASFNMLVTRPTSPPHGTFDYAYAYRSTSSGQLVSFQYNSAHKKNFSRHLGTGKYQITFSGPKTSGTRGIVKVSAYGDLPGDCELVSWKGSAKGEVVNVDCYGVGHVAQNRKFVVTFATANSLMGINGQVDANAFANSRSAVYQPAVQFDSKHGARVTIVHYELGDYGVLAAGSSGNVARFGGDVQVSAVGTTGAHCFSDGWSQELTPSLSVECVDRHGHSVDSPFTVEWVVP